MTDSPSERGQDVMVTARMNQTLCAALDAYCLKQGISRGEALRRAVVALTGASPVPRKVRTDTGGEHRTK